MVQRTRLANLTELTILQCHTRIQEENIIQLQKKGGDYINSNAENKTTFNFPTLQNENTENNENNTKNKNLQQTKKDRTKNWNCSQNFLRIKMTQKWKRRAMNQ